MRCSRAHRGGRRGRRWCARAPATRRRRPGRAGGIEAALQLGGLGLRRVVVEDQVRAGAVQTPRDRGADALRCAGDQYDLAAEARLAHSLASRTSGSPGFRCGFYSMRAPFLPSPRTMSLPEPSTEARAHSDRVAAHIRADIERAGGWIPFARYMELALYAPGLGYYMAGARKLGADGDFTTAPELTPLYGHTLARVAAQVLGRAGGEILEIGAGSGALAASALEELERLGALPASYLILELSPELRARSRDTLAARVPHLMERIAW